MNGRTITRTDSVTEREHAVGFNGSHEPPRPPNGGWLNRKSFAYGMIALLAVIALIVVSAFVLSPSDDERSGDSDEADGTSLEAERASGDEPYGSDHESLLQMTTAHKLDQVGISYSGNPNDIYLVVTSAQGTEYDLSVKVDTGEPVTRSFDSNEDFLVLTPEETGLTIEDGRTGSGADPTALGDQCQSEFEYGTSFPACPYIVSFSSIDSFNTGVEVGVLAADGQGNLIRNSSMRRVTDNMFFYGTGQDERFDQDNMYVYDYPFD